MPHSPATLRFYPGKIAGFTASLAGMIIALCGISGLVSAETRTQEKLIAITMPGGALIHAELAATPQERSRGLMFRENLAKDRGMLFAFAEAQPWTFWMKNTKIQLDIIWMDGKKQVVHIERNVPICTRTDETCPQYRPTDNAMFVLELAGGVAETFKLQRGAKLQFLQP